MAYTRLPANWQDTITSKRYSADQNTLEQVINAHSTDLETLLAAQSSTTWAGVTLIGTAQLGQVPTAISATVAQWATPATSSGGSSGGSSGSTTVSSDGILTPEMYGAKGDGSTDDTTAMQNWITAVTNALGHKTGKLSSGKIYKIVSALTISTPGSITNMWIIDGNGSTIKQATDNTACIKITGEGINGCVMRNLYFDYVNQQTAAGAPSGGVGAVVFDYTSSLGFGIWGNLYENITFSTRCFRGFMTLEIAGHSNSIWGSVWNNIRSEYGSTGSTIRNRSLTGVPNNLYNHVYQNAHACSEPTIDINNHQVAQIWGLEVNERALGGPDVYAPYNVGVELRGVRSEIGINASGEGKYVFDHVMSVMVEDWHIVNHAYANPGSIFKLTASNISIGPGDITTYSGSVPGANLTVCARTDTTSLCTRYEAVIKPSAAILDFSSGFGKTVPGANASFPTIFGTGYVISSF